MHRLFRLALVVLAFSFWAQGSDSDEHEHDSNCADHLQPRFMHEILPSGRDFDVLPLYEKVSRLLFERQVGLVDRLGIANPPHFMQMAPDRDLTALSVLGGHPRPHWYDGAQVARALANRSGVMEFVHGGCPTCRSYYRDTTKKEHQISIIFHVVGHNDFSVWSPYLNTTRKVDPMKESLELSELMVKLYQKHDHDEVSLWYQFLQSIGDMQDFGFGTYEPSEKFVPPEVQGLAEQLRRDRGRSENRYGSTRHPKIKTPNALQAFIANLPANLAPWKVELAKKFERTVRIYPGIVATKIMNEGWATLMMELLPMHTPYADDHHIMEYADLFQGVAINPGRRGFSYGNPYWMGRECWRLIRRRFEKTLPKDMDQLEKDRRFIEFAHKEVIAKMDDFDFILFALDEHWVREQGLFLYRDARRSEWDYNLPRDEDWTKDQQKVVTSTDPGKIIGQIANQIANKNHGFPRIHLTNLLGKDGRVELEHEVILETPLYYESAVQNLYVISQILEKPVCLTTVGSSSWDFGSVSSGQSAPWDFFNRFAKTELYPIRIVVSPSGTVKTYRLEEQDGENTEANETYDAALTSFGQDAIDDHRDDLSDIVNDDLRDFLRGRFAEDKLKPLMASTINAQTESTIGLLSHAPTATRAILEYTDLLNRLMVRAIQRAIAGKQKMRRTSNGVVISVLPQIPKFELDFEIREIMRQQQKATPVDGERPPMEDEDDLYRPFPFVQNQAPQFGAVDLPAANDGDVDIGNGRGPKRGDRFWGRKKKKGDGSGRKGKKPGDPGDQPDEGELPGEGHLDPHEVFIPLDAYAEFLANEIELPNLRWESDKSKDKRRVITGGKRQPFGSVIWPRTMANVIPYGHKELRRRGIDPRTASPQDVLKAGMRYMQEDDYVVQDHIIKRLPDKNAVVVFTIDLTGSMSGRPIELTMEMVWNIKLLLDKRYKNVVYRFVGFDTQAKEFKEPDIWKTFMGGGTRYSSGLELSYEILQEEKYKAYNKYQFTFGDGQSSDVDPTMKLIGDIYDICQYSGFALTEYMGGWASETFMDPIRAYAHSNEWFGYTDFDDNEASVLDGIRRLFGTAERAATP